MRNKNSKKLVILIVIMLFTVFSIVTAIAVGLDNTTKKNNDEQTNSLAYIYDESVNILEPIDKAAEIPENIYWEPMLGCYVSKELEYNPKTRSFEEVLGNVDPKILEDENREIYWWENEFDENNEAHMAIKLMKENWVSTEKMQSIVDQESFQIHIVPLGIDAIDEFLVMAIDKNIFNKTCLSAIGVIGQVNCTEWESLGIDSVSMDDNTYHHELWKRNFYEIMAELNSKNVDIDDIDKYGVFILPYLSESYAKDTDFINGIISLKFNIKSITGLKTALTTQRFFEKNSGVILMLEEVIEKYSSK